MPEHYRKRFSKKKVQLTSGGCFEFDAVSPDDKIVANISTSSVKTKNGKHASGKVTKVRSDIYFLLLANAERTLMLLTERDMHSWWKGESENGRVPDSIEFFHVEIPAELIWQLRDSRQTASREVSPP